MLDLRLGGITTPNDRFLDFCWRILANGQRRQRRAGNGGPTGLAQLQGRIHITMHKHTLNSQFQRSIGSNEFLDTEMNEFETISEGILWCLDAAVCQAYKLISPYFKDAVPGNTRTRVDT